LIDGRGGYKLEFLCLLLARLLDEVAGVARVEDGEHIALDLFVTQFLLDFVPVGFGVSAEAFAHDGVRAGRELEELFVFMEEPVAGIVDDKQTVGPVVVADKVADMAAQLVLRLRADIELDGLGLVVEAVAEECLELDSLAQSAMGAHNSGGHEGAYLVLGPELIQLICPLDQQHSNLCISIGLVHVLPHLRVPPCLHLLGALLVLDILDAGIRLFDQLHTRLVVARAIEVVVDALHADVGVDDLVLEWVDAVVGAARRDAAFHDVGKEQRGHVGWRHCSGRARSYKAESVRSSNHSGESGSLHQPSFGPHGGISNPGREVGYC
jgi:hypothetical protein